MTIAVMKLHPDAILPSYAHPFGDAGLDLFTLEDLRLIPNQGRIIKARTGIAVEIPIGYVGLIWDKSGLAINHGLKVMGGVIDSGYRGEIIVGLTNLGDCLRQIQRGSKIAQLLIQPVELARVIEVDHLSDSIRGDKGFGSTGL